VRAERTKRAMKLACVVPAAPVPSTGAFLLTTGALVVVVGSGDGSVAGFCVVVVWTVVVVVGRRRGSVVAEIGITGICTDFFSFFIIVYRRTSHIVVDCALPRNFIDDSIGPGDSGRNSGAQCKASLAFCRKNGHSFSISFLALRTKKGSCALVATDC